jgi:hypothetical protein
MAVVSCLSYRVLLAGSKDGKEAATALFYSPRPGRRPKGSVHS